MIELPLGLLPVEKNLRKHHREGQFLLASGSEAATILYDSEICPKSVGCKIVDLRSRMRSLYPVMNGSVMTLKEDNRFLSVWLLIHSCILCHVELHCIF